MKPLQKEHLPKVIALGLMTTGLLGYAAYSWLGHGGAPTPAVASPAHPAPPPLPAVPKPAPNDPVMALGPIDHENPFVPAFTAPSTTPAAPKPAPPAAKPAAKPASQPARPNASPGTMIAALPDHFNGPAMDGDQGVAVPALAPVAPPAAKAPAPHPAAKPVAPAKPARAAKPAPPAAPRPPAVTVTGIIEGQEDVAILKWQDGRGQVVHASDHLAGGYVVKAIQPDAVVLSLGSHQWVARLGAAAN